MTHLYMMVGLPGSGKSTWIAQKNITNSVILSTDAYIESEARRRGVSYSDLFDSLISEAEQMLSAELDLAVKNNQVIYWDQTNVTVKSRARKLRRIPAHYEKHAVYFDTPISVIQERLKQRETETGKRIPDQVVRNLASILVPPSLAEGFDTLEIVR